MGRKITNLNQLFNELGNWRDADGRFVSPQNGYRLRGFLIDQKNVEVKKELFKVLYKALEAFENPDNYPTPDKNTYDVMNYMFIKHRLQIRQAKRLMGGYVPEKRFCDDVCGQVHGIKAFLEQTGAHHFDEDTTDEKEANKKSSTSQKNHSVYVKSMSGGFICKTFNNQDIKTQSFNKEDISMSPFPSNNRGKKEKEKEQKSKDSKLSGFKKAIKKRMKVKKPNNNQSSSNDSSKAKQKKSNTDDKTGNKTIQLKKFTVNSNTKTPIALRRYPSYERTRDSLHPLQRRKTTAV